MANNSAAIQRLEAEGFWPLPGILIGSVDRSLEQLTRKRPPQWVSLSVLAVAVFTVVGLTSFLFRESWTFLLDGAWIAFLTVLLGSVQWVNRVLSHTLHGKVWNALEEENDRVEFEHFLLRARNLRWQIPVLIVFVCLNGMVHYSLYGQHIHVLVFSLYNGLIGGLALLCVALILSVLVQLGSYRFKLYPLDPAKTELIYELNRIFTSFAYLIAFTGVAITLLVWLSATLIGGSDWFLWTIGFVSWICLSIFFFVLHHVLRTIIRRAKWKTLQEIQAQAAELRSKEGIPSEETLEHLNKLMDHHNRVLRTKDSMLNIDTFMTYLKTMLLPFLAALLPFLDTALVFFQRFL